MADASPPVSYAIAKREVVAETPDLRVVRMTLAAGESIPWHHHTTVQDTSFCLRGRIEIEAREPDEVYRLEPGQWATIVPGRRHTVVNRGADDALVLLVQGVGPYDFLKA
jgi:quercetin dioxygenase-like cupin family protein